LKIAFFGIVVAREGDLRLLPFELLQDPLVCDVALLVVFMYNQPSFVANAALIVRHEGIACVVILADIAVYAFPTRLAFAGRAFPRWPLVAHSQRAA
jgi:hypothetical protein